MSNFPGFHRNTSYTRDGALSPSIEDFHELFPADIMDRLNDDVGDMIDDFALDAYELMNDFTNVSSTSIDRYFPGDNQDEFLSADYVNKPTTNRSRTIKEEEVTMPPGIVKPCYPYACLIALALKNSGEGQLSVADIYTFIMENFPYYQHAQPGWKNSIRHNLSLNKSFEKIEQPNTSVNATRKTYLWKMVPGMAEKMETELSKFSTEDVKASLKDAGDFESIRNGTKGMPNVDQSKTPDFGSESGNAHVIVKKMNEFFKKEKERKSRGKQAGAATGSSQSVRQVAEMALGQLLHVKIEIEPPAKCRSRHQSVNGPDPPPRRRSDVQCNEGPSTSNEHATNSVIPLLKMENPTHIQLETDEFLCSSQQNENYFPPGNHWADCSGSRSETPSDSSSIEKPLIEHNRGIRESTIARSNFILNGLPFKRKFGFHDESTRVKYLKRAPRNINLSGNKMVRTVGQINRYGFQPCCQQDFYEDKENNPI